jgi:hypothetical protein
VGDDTAWRVQAEHGALAGIERVPSGAAIQKEAARLRRPYIDWIGSLARANDSLEWWACELAARNSYTMLFSNICALAAARRLVDDSTLTVCSSPALAEELLAFPGAQPVGSFSARAEREIARRALLAWVRLTPRPLTGLPGRLSERVRMGLDADPRHRRRTLAAHDIPTAATFEGDDTVLLFTWIDRRSFPPEGGYRDPHLGVLPELLRERGFRVAFVPRILHTIAFAEAVERLLESNETFFIPDLYLDPDDWHECANRAKAFRVEMSPEASIEGVRVARLALEHVERYTSAQAAALTYGPLVRNLAAAGIRPARIVHPYEGHTWELALIRSVHQYLPETTLIGYENLNMSRFALSMYPASAELGLRPLPDRIVTNGSAFARVLREEGVPDELIRPGCALRHASLWNDISPPRPRSTAIRVLVATDGTLGHAAELVAKAVAALGGEARYNVTVKCHPLVPQNRVRALIGGVEGSNVHFASEPIAELLPSTDVMLYTHSAVCWEALGHGVPPVFVQSESIVDLDQLEPFAELRRQARTPDEIRAAVDELVALSEHALVAWRKSARTAAREALAPVTTECADAFVAAG